MNGNCKLGQPIFRRFGLYIYIIVSLHVISLHFIFITAGVPTAASFAVLKIVFIPCTSKCVCMCIFGITKEATLTLLNSHLRGLLVTGTRSCQLPR